MATELSDASLKLVLTLEEARSAVDEIEREQARRRGAVRPGFAPPDEVPVVRPDAGRSAVTGDKEPPLPTPGGDARVPSGGTPRELDDGSDEVQRGAARATRVIDAAGSIIGSPGSGAAALGTELARGGTMAAARAAGVAGPVGVALAAGAMAGRELYERGPGLAGFARGLGGPVAEAAVSQALTGSPGGLRAWREMVDQVGSRISALDSTVSDMTEIAAAQVRVGGRLDSPALARLGTALYSSHQQLDYERRAQEAAGSSLRGEAGGQFLKDGLDRFIEGNQ